MTPGNALVGSSRRVTAPVDLRRRWTEAFVVGELIGFVPPAIAGASLAAVGAPDIVMVVALTIAGLAEGAAIGTAQAHVLGPLDAGIDTGRWRDATIAAAGFAWFVGMSGGALLGTFTTPWLLVALVPAWIAALLAMGFLQWRVLRGAIPHSHRWVPVTAGAWLLGVAIPVVALSIVPSRVPIGGHAAVGVVAAVAMGVVVGRLTGGTLVALLEGSDNSTN